MLLVPRHVSRERPIVDGSSIIRSLFPFLLFSFFFSFFLSSSSQELLFADENGPRPGRQCLARGPIEGETDEVVDGLDPTRRNDDDKGS